MLRGFKRSWLFLSKCFPRFDDVNKNSSHCDMGAFLLCVCVCVGVCCMCVCVCVCVCVTMD